MRKSVRRLRRHGNEERELADEMLVTAIRRARDEGSRLLQVQRSLLAIGVAGLVVVAIRGIVAVAWGAAGSPPLAIALGLAVAVCGWLIMLGLRVRQRMENLARDLQALDLTREGRTGGLPRVETLLYEPPEGDAQPIVTVRTDSLERLFRRPR